MRSIVASCCFVIFVVLAFIGPGCQGAPSDAGTGVASGDASVAASTESVATETTIGVTTTTARTTTTTQLSPAEAILQQMSLQRKAAQVLLLAFAGTTLTPTTSAFLMENPPGGFLLLGHNVTGAAQLRALTSALQSAAVAGGSPVGLLIAVDQEGGPVQRVRDGVPILPAAREVGEDFSLLQASRLAAETAAGLLELGVNMNLAPVADVVSDPQSFLYWRTYSGDPTVVSDFVAAVTEAYVHEGLIVAVKHFPGHGSAPGNTHSKVVVSSAGEAEFATVHLPPFKAALAAGAQCVMMAHVVVPAYGPDLPASLSSRIVVGLLREGLGFSGLVVTDDLEMAAVAETQPANSPDSGEDAAQTAAVGPADVAVRALEAGCDLLISTGTSDRQQAMLDAIVEAVQTGRLARDRLDEAVTRVLNLKLRHGLGVP